MPAASPLACWCTTGEKPDPDLAALARMRAQQPGPHMGGRWTARHLRCARHDCRRNPRHRRFCRPQRLPTRRTQRVGDVGASCFGHQIPSADPELADAGLLPGHHVRCVLRSRCRAARVQRRARAHAPAGRLPTHTGAFHIGTAAQRTVPATRCGANTPQRMSTHACAATCDR